MKLTIFFSLYEMSDTVAKRGMTGPPKQYKVTPMHRQFADTSVASAKAEILTEFGSRPPQPDPMKPSTQLAHKFAEIWGWTATDDSGKVTKGLE